MSSSIKLIAIIAELAALLCSVAAEGADAIVEIAAATGVVVSPSGLTLTCKHGLPPDRVDVIHPRLGTLDGKIVYVPEMVDGVVAIQLPPGTYDYIPVSPRRPRLHESVTVHAFGNRSRSGTVGSWRWETCQYYGGKKVRVNHCTAPIEVGWSGGPMLDSDGYVCGIALMGSPRDSLYAGWEETSAVAQRFAWNRVNDKPTIDLQPGDAVAIENPQEPYTWVYVFTMPNCPPCDRFKADLAAYPEFFKDFRFKFFDVMEPGGNVHGLKTVPQFRQIGGEFIRGYKGKEWLLSQLMKPEPVEQAPAVPPVSTIPADATPIADSAPVAPPIEQPKPVEQPPPAPAARVEPSTKVTPESAWVWGWGLSLAQIGIAFATGGVGAGAVTAAGKLWGLRARRKRSPSEPASAGETRAGPYGPCIRYDVPELPIYRVPDIKAINSVREAFDRSLKAHAHDERATGILTQAYEIFRQAMSAPDK